MTKTAATLPAGTVTLVRARHGVYRYPNSRPRIHCVTFELEEYVAFYYNERKNKSPFGTADLFCAVSQIALKPLRLFAGVADVVPGR